MLNILTEPIHAKILSVLYFIMFAMVGFAYTVVVW